MNGIILLILKTDFQRLTSEPLDCIYDDFVVKNLVSSYCFKQNVSVPNIKLDKFSFPKEVLGDMIKDSLDINVTSSPEEIFELCERAKQDDQEAKNLLFEKNLYLAISIAYLYKTSGIAIQDLIQEANIGLFNAINKYSYDYERLPLEQYATLWIRHSIAKVVSKQEEKTKQSEPSLASFQKEIMFYLDNAQLTANERNVLIRRYGLNGKNRETQSQIASTKGVTRQSVAYMEKSALEKIAKAKIHKESNEKVAKPNDLYTVYEYFYQYDKETIDKAIEQLTPKQKEALVARFGEDLTKRMPRGETASKTRKRFYSNVAEILKRKMEIIAHGASKRKGHPKAEYDLVTIYEVLDHYSKK